MVRHLKAVVFVLPFEHSLGSFTICYLMVVITRTYVLGSAYRVPSILSLLCRIRMTLFHLLDTIRISFHLLISAVIYGLGNLIWTLFMIYY